MAPLIFLVAGHPISVPQGQASAKRVKSKAGPLSINWKRNWVASLVLAVDDRCRWRKMFMTCRWRCKFCVAKTFSPYIYRESVVTFLVLRQRPQAGYESAEIAKTTSTRVWTPSGRDSRTDNSGWAQLKTRALKPTLTWSIVRFPYRCLLWILQGLQIRSWNIFKSLFIVNINISKFRIS
jgi:hypothetical protein